ncbi:MAG: CotY/CotZ family spore coat protein [Bacilli bacterium]
MCNEEKKCNKCVEEILNVILILQENASCFDTNLESCDKGFLGQCSTSFACNTRPVMLYLCNGTALCMPSEKNSVVADSHVFRIEKLDHNCATFRVLSMVEGTDPVCYDSTNSFFTVNLNCVCCIRCLCDTYIDCL